MVKDERLVAARQIKELEHNWVVSLVMSPPPENGDLIYPPLPLRTSIEQAEQLGATLCQVISDFYGGLQIKSHRGVYEKGKPLTVYIASKGKIIAHILMEVQGYGTTNGELESFTPLAFLSVGVKDHPTICSLMGRLGDEVVLRNLGRIEEEGGSDSIIDYYALLTESKPKVIRPKHYWVNDVMFGKIGFEMDKRRIYRH